MGDRFIKQLSKGNSVTIPQAIRRVHGMTPGDDVLIEVHGVTEDGELQEPYEHEDQTALGEFEYEGDQS